MKTIFQRLIKYPVLLSIVLIPLSCATTEKEGSLQTAAEKTKPAAVEVTEPSFITKLTTEMLEDGSRVYIKASSPIQYTAFKLADPLRLILDISDMKPKPEALVPIEFNKGAIKNISTHYFAESNITRVIINLNQNVSHDITKSADDELRIDIDLPSEIQAKADISEITLSPPLEALEDVSAKDDEDANVEKIEVVEDEAESIEEKKKYTGQLISLDFQNADLTSILRLIAGVSKLNIITSPDVEGTITLRLIDVPWDQALNLILKNNKLGMQREGNIIRITTMKRFTEEKQEEIAAAEMSKKSRETVEKLISKTIQISYAKLDELKTRLDGMKSERGVIQIDDRTSTIFIRDIQSNIDDMVDVINNSDRRTKQISIEARIVEVNTNYSKALGIQWGGIISETTSEDFPSTIGVRGGLGGGALGGSATADNFLVDLPAAVGSGTGGAISMTLGSLSGAYLLDLRLSAMEKDGKGKIISSPKITTLNHMSASIKSGRTFFIETVSSEGTQSTAINADIELTVTPHANPDGFIRLEILATKNEADFGQTSAGGTPTIITKKIKTEVLVKNGHTTVLGGLYKTTKADSDSGIPFLSKIPIIKWFFKHEAKTSATEELLIFITPTIVEGS